MQAWWSSLTTPLQVYYGVAFVTTGLLFLQLLLSFFGFDSDLDGDLDVDVSLDAGHGSGLGFLSVKGITGFFTGFGWGGVIALEGGWPPAAAILLSIALGTALMTIIYGLLRGIYSLRYSGTLDYRNAVGVAGSVYLPIPPNMEGPGQIEVLVQGRLQTVRAFTRATHRLPNRARVKVIDVVDPSTLLVEPLDPPSDHPGVSPEKE